MHIIKLHIFSSLIFFVLQPALLILLLIALFKKNEQMAKIILGTNLFLYAVLFLSYFTGEATKNMISNFPAVTDEVLDPHENAARILFYLSIAATLLTAAAFKFFNKKIFIKIFCGLLVCLTVYQVHVSILGLKIRHTEIRNQVQHFNMDED